mgnify:CR=1 FL=1
MKVRAYKRKRKCSHGIVGKTALQSAKSTLMTAGAERTPTDRAFSIIIFLFNLLGNYLSENLGRFHRTAVMRNDKDFEIFLFISHKLPPLSSVWFSVCGLCWLLLSRIFFLLLCFFAFALGADKVIYVVALNDFLVSAYHALNLRKPCF